MVEYVSKDVVFNELCFPYNELFPSSVTLPFTVSPSLPSIPLIPPLVNQSNPSVSPPYHSVSLPTTSIHTTSSLSTTNDVVPSTPFTFPTSSSSTSPLNTHPMTTRSKAGIVKPHLVPVLLLTHTEPKTGKQAIADPH